MLVSIRIAEDLRDVDWAAVKADLTADDFDSGRSPAALRRSFEASQLVAIAWDDDHVVGTARALSDGVCNTYVIDVWTKRTHRRAGVGAAMMRSIAARVPGQHIGLQTDDAQAFYARLGYAPQPEFLSLVVGRWLDNDANR
jgi:predicted GNAT family acetyltransferase